MKFSTVVGALSVMALWAGHAGAQQEDGGVSYFGRGQEVLESIYVPHVAGAPFSLQLSVEWTRPLSGGTMTAVNSRPIKRNSQGRIYMAALAAGNNKGNIGRSRLSRTQIDDPVSGIYCKCNARTHVFHLL